jgi:hypothetical protein
MGNTENHVVTLIGKTYRNDDNPVSLTIPKEVANQLDFGFKGYDILIGKR